MKNPNTVLKGTFKLRGGVYEIEYVYIPGHPGTHWDPPESPEVELQSIKTIEGKEITEYDFIFDCDLYYELVDRIEEGF